MNYGDRKQREGSLEINIWHVAELANLPLDPARAQVLEKQLNETLSYIESLNEISTENVEPTSQVTGLTNITRDDTLSASLSQKDALHNGPATYNGFFMVDAIFEE